MAGKNDTIVGLRLGGTLSCRVVWRWLGVAQQRICVVMVVMMATTGHEREKRCISETTPNPEECQINPGGKNSKRRGHQRWLIVRGSRESWGIGGDFFSSSVNYNHGCMQEVQCSWKSSVSSTTENSPIGSFLWLPQAGGPGGRGGGMGGGGMFPAHDCWTRVEEREDWDASDTPVVNRR